MKKTQQTTSPAQQERESAIRTAFHNINEEHLMWMNPSVRRLSIQEFSEVVERVKNGEDAKSVIEPFFDRLLTFEKPITENPSAFTSPEFKAQHIKKSAEQIEWLLNEFKEIEKYYQ